MTVAPMIDPSWHRLPEDAFGAGPSTLTPLDPSSSIPRADESDSDGSEWSFCDQEELITLDLGTERVAKRALLGYSVGLDYSDADPIPAAASSSSRSIRGFRGSGGVGDGVEMDKRIKRGTDPKSSLVSSSNGPHLGAGKQLSITGLDTSTPLLKINDTVLRGSNMTLFGSEIVIVDHFDPTRPRNSQHRLQPIPPSISDGRANLASSTTRRRILFKPIYDPAARETSTEDGEGYEKLRALAKPPAYVLANEAKQSALDEQHRLASLANLLSAPSDAQADSSQAGVGRGKNKRKDVSQGEQMIRAMEKKIRKAAKLYDEEQKEQREHQDASATPKEGAADQSQHEIESGSADQGSIAVQDPPPSFEGPS
ncbi:hypothetical protein EX895_005908 [Sporisorium graminicola]|uniref:Transcription factor TFIIIC triple barrel domain-containing protein n=1 Tax=Sporisorium graminicola TaxID=280036 RepID=A0A4U7KNZ4_9BASI|nr:hypothetical protein EX895_005908 [Sporisorium graminicola]TKY84828.1 hypothetical protein EX895_005908 [Sporisorium graminicola]